MRTYLGVPSRLPSTRSLKQLAACEHIVNKLHHETEAYLQVLTELRGNLLDESNQVRMSHLALSSSRPVSRCRERLDLPAPAVLKREQRSSREAEPLALPDKPPLLAVKDEAALQTAIPSQVTDKDAKPSHPISTRFQDASPAPEPIAGLSRAISRRASISRSPTGASSSPTSRRATISSPSSRKAAIRSRQGLDKKSSRIRGSATKELQQLAELAVEYERVSRDLLPVYERARQQHARYLQSIYQERHYFNPISGEIEPRPQKAAAPTQVVSETTASANGAASLRAAITAKRYAAKQKALRKERKAAETKAGRGTPVRQRTRETQPAVTSRSESSASSATGDELVVLEGRLALMRDETASPHPARREESPTLDMADDDEEPDIKAKRVAFERLDKSASKMIAILQRQMSEKKSLPGYGRQGNLRVALIEQKPEYLSQRRFLSKLPIASNVFDEERKQERPMTAPINGRMLCGLA
ncbi:unnamed protein product [Vitrella brassicaformis CCMP3155]|uniref:Uncharacterized protein n=1 Tax=Vitrella brassicaformis (strain CCMP3155) TaxID=1169540 RepID=A0A0G4FJ50_VITBC|nr:unnamed protein product [Vitrella brassicaformis CCMP3155]|eukprot:CEM13805.1 unnamed protein product [Vitrella brassicaformis CCMP3155]